ncbi:hypothetical protein Tco_1239891 [Tanacetum coccineum]
MPIAHLTPLFKPDNGIRPIVVGNICRLFVSKVAMKCVGKEMSKVLSEYHNDESLAMLIVDILAFLLHAWYLADGTIIGDSEVVVKVLDIIKASSRGLGLELNIKKTTIFWPLYNGMKLRGGLFPVNIWRP